MQLLEIYTPSELARYADTWVDQALSGENVNLYDWVYTESLPLEMFHRKPHEQGDMRTLQTWEDWFEGANDEAEMDQGMRYWDYLLDEPIDTPIVVTADEEDGSGWHIWDGWHRVAASIVTGRKTIPAVIGYYKKD